MPTPREAYTNSVAARPDAGERLRPADYGGAGEIIARAGERFGQDLSQSIDNLTEIQKRDAQTAAQEADNMRVANRLKRLYEGEDGYFNKNGKAALIDAEQVPKDLEAIDKNVADNLLKHNPWARKMYDDMGAKRNADDLPRIYQHASKEREAHEKTVDEAAFDLAIDNASSSLDPKIIEENIATVGNLAVKRLMRDGETDNNVFTQGRQTAVGKAVEAVAKRMELQSPGEAQAFVTTHAKDMDPQDAAKLLDSLAPAAAQEKAYDDVRHFIVSPAAGAQPAPEGTSSPANAAPTPIPPEEALAAAQWAVEAGGRHTNPDGSLITSGTSVGISQLKKSNIAPGSKGFGYGVVGPKNNSREEFIRVGNDYRNAMIKHYGGNVVLGLTAYNWGPGNVDAHIKAVGDPRKGQISDAAFVNSIPDKDGRVYAAKVLQHAGVSVSGPAQQPTNYYGFGTGQEVDLSATIDRINASDKTYPEKQALIAAATRLHGLGRQAKADAEERVTDAAWTEINKFAPGEFTNYTKLPLDVRQQLATNPRLELSIKGMAANNAEAKQAKIDAEDKAARTEKAQQSELNLTELHYAAPEAFDRIDFRTAYPELEHTDRLKFMEMQDQYRKSQTGGKGPDVNAMRTTFQRFAGPAIKDDQARMGYNFNQALMQEQQVLSEPGRNGKPLTEIEREAIARRVLMPVVLHTAHGGAQVVTRAEAPEKARGMGSNFRGADADLREQARNAFVLKNKRLPSDGELDAAVTMWRRTHPSGYQYGAQ